MKRRKSAYGKGAEGAGACGRGERPRPNGTLGWGWAPGIGCAPRRAREGLGGRVAMQRL